jgi:hypothetical protein
MTSTASFNCSISTTDASAALGLEIWFDDDQIFNTDHVDRTIDFEQIFSDNEGEHELRFVLKNKTIDHTQVDENGNIIKDACLTISDMAFEEITLGHTFIQQAVYKHDFNGTQPPIEDKFFGSMGCNGTVTLKFSTPIYLWLLEHL